jgi:hypothetical protein
MSAEPPTQYIIEHMSDTNKQSNAIFASYSALKAEINMDKAIDSMKVIFEKGSGSTTGRIKKAIRETTPPAPAATVGAERKADE